MRKIFMVGASAAASVLLMTGCNKQVIDLTYEYRSTDKAGWNRN